MTLLEPRRSTLRGLLWILAAALACAPAGVGTPPEPTEAASLATTPASEEAELPPLQPREELEGAQAFSLLGTPLYPPALPPEVLREREEELESARAALAAAPADADALIWVGRRTAYLGNYRASVELFSQGVAKHPNDPRFLRHRGHRYLTLRRPDLAVRDLARAAAMITGQPDEVEPDGLPNARNIPTSTLHSNIWYHLGLAHYLQADFESALAAYRACEEVSKNADMRVATAHWLYMTLRRLGSEAEAAAVLAPITAEMEILENEGYHQLLRFYQGQISEQELTAGAGEDALQGATLGYGLGNWHLYNGQPERAEEIFRQVLAGPQWAAFGYLAAETDLARGETER